MTTQTASSPGETFLKRVLAARKPAHAYLFFGPESAGKERMAIEFAGSLLCREEKGERCGTCLSCRKIKSGNHPDLRIIPPDGERIKIAQIRALKAETQYGPLEGAWKFFIILKSDSMTEEAAQSLLKVLEEPPRQIVILLTALHPIAILPTLASRCQWVPIQPPSLAARTAELVARGVPLEQAAVMSGLQAADDRIEGLKEVLKGIPESFFSEPKSPFELFERASLLWDYKGNGDAILDLFLVFYRDVLVWKSGWPEGILLGSFRSTIEQYANKLSWWEIGMKLQAVEEARLYLNRSGNFRLVMDNLLYKLK